MRVAGLVVSAFLASTSLLAADAWVVTGYEAGPAIGSCGFSSLWTAGSVVRNPSGTPGTVTFVGLSGPEANPRVGNSITVPPGKTVSLPNSWNGPGNVGIWIQHLDVDSNLLLLNSVSVGEEDCHSNPVDGASYYGTISFPVVHRLHPAGDTETLLGADLGAVDAHLNVGIYNGGTGLGTAHVTVRRACDESLLAQSDVTLAPNDFIQITLLPTAPVPGCTGADQVDQFVRYATVTMDQPFFAYAASIANSFPDTPLIMKVPFRLAVSN